jgi:hypothetical protein
LGDKQVTQLSIDARAPSGKLVRIRPAGPALRHNRYYVLRFGDSDRPEAHSHFEEWLYYESARGVGSWLYFYDDGSVDFRSVAGMEGEIFAESPRVSVH